MQRVIFGERFIILLTLDEQMVAVAFHLLKLIPSSIIGEREGKCVICRSRQTLKDLLNAVNARSRDLGNIPLDKVFVRYYVLKRFYFTEGRTGALGIETKFTIRVPASFVVGVPSQTELRCRGVGSHQITLLHFTGLFHPSAQRTPFPLSLYLILGLSFRVDRTLFLILISICPNNDFF
jgi:hypothetical protein